MSTPGPSRPVIVRCAICGVLNRVDLTCLAQGPRCAECGRPLLLDRPIKTTDDDFEQTISSASVPVVVDFYADWCGPCRVMAPALDEFARRHAGQVLVLKLDTDANPRTGQRFGIRGIPTIIAFHGGQEVGRHVGVADLTTLEQLVT